MGWSGGAEVEEEEESYRSFEVVIGRFDGCDAGMFFIMLKTWARVCDRQVKVILA